MPSPSLLVLATGGTIAGEAGSATRRDYRPGQIDIATFLQDVAALELPARLEGRQVANIDSANIGPAIWRDLHQGISAAIADPDCDGIIITHGTDTAEETAFLLDLTLPPTKPVILVGAMRAADAVGSDGLRNFANAVKVAAHAEAPGRGVLLVMGDQVLSARDARKARTTGSNAFESFPRGAAALATPASLDWLQPQWRLGESARWNFPEEFPRVPILHCYAGQTADSVTRLVEDGARGIVLAGLGDGNAPDVVRSALADAARQGIVVVRSTRVDEGLVDREPEDDANGFVASRALGPAKARILCQVLIANGVTDPERVQNAFNNR
ncbi:asparaginase [Aurantiacibacter hainanensis]|uniref:asparaginase n=1 Tax=Aurantiacibacter hainanensis TaxID=3076114 RepID=UPI0030C6C31B